MSDSQHPTDFATFGELLRHLRRRAHLTQREVGLAVGYSEAHIARLESGTRLPDSVAVKGVFVEAFDLQREPALVAQLVELAQRAHNKAKPMIQAGDAPSTHTEPATHHSRLPGNLQTPATRLIGREKDAAAVAHLLGRADVRVLTLVGPPGVGKTRLAIEVAREVSGDFADGVWFVELASYSEPQSVLIEIAKILEIEERPSRSIMWVLQNDLRDRQLLLVLDNLEQVLDAAPLIGQMLSATSEVKVVATSRELLRIAGEQGYTVNPLAEEAVDLFVQRAHAVKSTFVLNAANAATIAEICRKLDGLPLAIELAAARIALFTPSEVLVRLDQRLPLLTGGARDLPARQRTLRATIDWSYTLLAPDEQALFRRLGVFAGGFTLHAVQAFCATSDEVSRSAEDILAALLAKNLIRQVELSNGSSRYQLLETLREYAFEQLTVHEEQDHWQREHADYITKILEPLGTSVVATEEYENWRAALEWALTSASSGRTGRGVLLGGLIDMQGSRSGIQERISLIERVTTHDNLNLYPQKAIDLLWRLGTMYRLIGDYPRALKAYEQTWSLSQKHALRSHEHAILIELGNISRDQGNFVKARAYLEEALARAHRLTQDADRKDTDEYRLNNFLFNNYLTLAEVAIAEENVAEAEQILNECHRLQTTVQIEPYLMGWLVNHQAHVALLKADFAKTRVLIEQGQQSMDADASKLDGVAKNWIETWNFHALGEAALAECNSKEAVQQFVACLKMSDELSQDMLVAWCLVGLAGTCALDEDPEQGARLWGAGEALRERMGCRIGSGSRPNRERALAMLREQLGEAEFVRLTAQGAAWTMEQALEQALGVALQG